MVEVQQVQQKIEKGVQVKKPVAQQTTGIKPVGVNQEKKSIWWIWVIVAVVIISAGIYFWLL